MIYTILDTETTGLSKYDNDIIQLAYVQVNDYMQKVASGCLFFYYDGISWTKEAEDIHKISLNSLRGYAPDFEQNLRKTYQLLYYGNLAGHNIGSFDLPFCREMLRRRGFPDMPVLSIHDTMHIYKHAVGKKPNLAEVCEYCKFSDRTIISTARQWFKGGDCLHDARFDVTVTALAFIRAVRQGML